MINKFLLIFSFFSLSSADFTGDLKCAFADSMRNAAICEILVEGLSGNSVPYHIRLRKRDKRIFFLLNTGYYAASGVGYKKLGEYRDLIIDNNSINSFIKTDCLSNIIDENASSFPSLKYIAFSVAGYLTGALISNFVIKQLKKMVSSK